MLDSLLFLSDFTPPQFNPLSLECSKRSKDKGKRRVTCQPERTGDRYLSSWGGGRSPGSGAQATELGATGLSARTPGPTQPITSTAWMGFLVLTTHTHLV